MKRGRSLSGMGLRVPVDMATGDGSPPSDDQVRRPTRKSAQSAPLPASMPPPSGIQSSVPLSSVSQQQSSAEVDCRSPGAKRRSSIYQSGAGGDGRLGGALRVVTPNKGKGCRSRTGSHAGGENAPGAKSESAASGNEGDGKSEGGRVKDNRRSPGGGRSGARGEGAVVIAAAGRIADTLRGSGHGSAAVVGGVAIEEDRLRMVNRSASSGSRKYCGIIRFNSSPTDDNATVSSALSLGGVHGACAARRVSVRRSGSGGSVGGARSKRSREERASSSSTESSNENDKRTSRGSSESNGSGGWSRNKWVSSSSSRARSKRGSRSSSESTVVLRVGVGECQECGESDDTEVCEGGAVLCEDCAAEARDEDKGEKPRKNTSTVRLLRRSSVAPSSLIVTRNVLSAPECPGDPTRNPVKQDFQVGRALGKGKFGNVYVAKYRGVTVALKLLWKSSVASDHMGDNVRREAEIQSRLRHPNIVRMPGFFEDPKTIYFVLDYAAGGDVYKVLRQHPQGLPEGMATRYLLGTARAVAYLHERHIIHRDIKPENLLLDSSGKVKLSDFGWSIHAVPPVEHERSTLCGTPEYVAPEMLLHSPRYTKAVDLWSLGILGFELLAGVTPFRDAQVSRTSGALSESPGLQHAATMAEANSADVNAALYGRIVGWKGSLEILCKEGMAGFRVPQAARTVLAGMMRPRATDRVSIEQALQLPWLMEAAAGQEDGVL